MNVDKSLFKTEPFPHQLAGVEYGLNMNNFILGDQPGLGKALALDTDILTPTGFKNIQAINIGDTLIDSDGKETIVLNKFYNCSQTMYRIKFNDNTYVDCCENHLWKTKVCFEDTPIIFKTVELFNMSKSKLNNKKISMNIASLNNIQYKKVSVPIDPYIFGCLLYRGNLSADNFQITCLDESIIKKVSKKLPENLKLNKVPNKGGLFNIVNVTGTRNKLRTAIRKLNLNTATIDRFIPNCYKYNTHTVRLGVLQGILDNISCVDRNGSIIISTTGKQLMLDTIELLRSFGCFCRMYETTNRNCTHPLFVCRIKLNKNHNFITSVIKKKQLKNKLNYNTNRVISSIDYLRNDDCICFTVDSPTSEFVIKDYIITHNTKVCLDLGQHYKKQGYKRCLILVCVSGLKYNWEDQVNIHSNEKIKILGARENKKGKLIVSSNKDKLEDLNNLGNEFYVVTNIESLVDSKITTKIISLITKKEIDLIFVDESHFIKNPTAKRSRALLRLKAKTKIAITGTPSINSPLDVYTILKWLGYIDIKYTEFLKYHCIYGGYYGKQIVGFKHLDQLKEVMNTIMIRRKKEDVLDLPEKIETTEYVELSKDERSLYNLVERYYIEEVKKLDDREHGPDELKKIKALMILRCRQITGNANILDTNVKQCSKLDRMLELVKDRLDNKAKTIVVSSWTQVADRAVKILNENKINNVYIHGKNRNNQTDIETFKTDKDCKVLVGTVGTMGCGFTLTVADTIIFLDSPWTEAAKTQVSDRVHRIGTSGTINIITLTCKDTFDEYVNEVVNKKGITNDWFLDDENNGLSDYEIINMIKK